MADRQALSSAAPRGDFADFLIASVCGLALAITAAALLVAPFSAKWAAGRDFIQYWASGHELVRHADPYDIARMTQVEEDAGLTGGVLLMRNPPWVLPLVLPLGFLDMRLAELVWSLAMVACLLLSVRTLRASHGDPPNHYHWLGFAFPPALICALMGQISLVALLGLVLFLRHQSRRPFAAGLALWLCTVKPHLFLPFVCVLLLWIAVTRRYRVLAGLVVAVTVSSALTYWMDPTAWTHYLAMVRDPGIEQEPIPCLARAFRMWLPPHAFWLQWLPAALSCVWAVIYFWRRRRTWDWQKNGNPLLMISVLFAPYGFVYDQCLIIPALMEGVYVTRSRLVLALLPAAYFGFAAQLYRSKIASFSFLWTVPVWLAWYFVARAAADKKAMTEPIAAA